MQPFSYNAQQLLTNWTSQADSPGPHGQATIIPGVEDMPMKIAWEPAKRPQGQPWDNLYVLQRHSGSDAETFAYLVSVTFPTQADLANCNAFELDFQMNTGPAIFNCGWQFLFGTGIRIWNRSVGAWVKSPVAPISHTDFDAGEPTRIAVLFARTNDSVEYLGVQLNQAWTPLSESFSAVAKPQTPYLNNAVQVDSKGQGAPIIFNLNECTLVGF